MRYGVLSDVHANLPALDAAIARLEAEGVDGWLCPGDLVGYGPFPDECVERVRDLGAVCVAGNHDLIALGRLSDSRCVPLARQTLAWTRTVLGDEARRWLGELPPRARVDEVVVAHGSLDDPQEYLRTPDQVARELERLEAVEPGAEVLLFGHTHRHGTYVRAGRLPLDDDLAWPAPPWALNAGSVGQSREWRAVARCAVLDTGARTVSHHALEYDLGATRAALRARGLPANACHVRPRPVRRLAGRLLRRAGLRR